MGGDLQPLRKLVRLPRLVDLLGHVERHAHELERLAVRVAAQHASRQHVAPAPVRAAVACFHVDRAVGLERGVCRSQHARQVVGVDERAHFAESQALGTRRDVEHLVRAVVVVHAVGPQVLAPDRDVAQVDGESQLLARVVERLCELIGLGVVDHDADRALGHAVRRVLHLPLRMQALHGSVGQQHAIACFVPARLACRLRVVGGRPVVRVDALRGDLEVRRAAVRVHAEEAEHVAVPAPFAGRDLAFPNAEPAELLGGVQQLGQALPLAQVLQAHGEMRAAHCAGVAGDRLGRQRAPAGVARRVAPGQLHPLHRSPRGQRLGNGGPGAFAGHRQQVGERPAERHARAAAARALEGRIDPDDAPRAVQQRHQVGAEGRERGPGALRLRPGGGVHAVVGTTGRSVTPHCATCSTSLPKFWPLKSFSSVSGKLSRPATMSSFDFIRPCFRYPDSSATATG